MGWGEEWGWGAAYPGGEEAHGCSHRYDFCSIQTVRRPPVASLVSRLKAGDQARHGGALIVMGKAEIVPMATAVCFFSPGKAGGGVFLQFFSSSFCI